MKRGEYLAQALGLFIAPRLPQRLPVVLCQGPGVAEDLWGEVLGHGRTITNKMVIVNNFVTIKLAVVGDKVFLSWSDQSSRGDFRMSYRRTATAEERLRNIVTMGVIAVIITMCLMMYDGDDDELELQTKAWEFGSLDQCISRIETDVGPLRIVRDKPDVVSGKTRDGNTFSCSKEVTGTRGTYYYGVYNR